MADTAAQPQPEALPLIRHHAWARGLRHLNVAVGIVFLVQGLAMLVFSNALALPVTAAFLRTDPVALRGPARPETLFSLAIGPAVAVFLLLAAADHLIVAAPRAHRWYERSITRSANSARWIEYSVSASIMTVLIAMFAGVRDVAALVGLFAATAAMILFGLLMERQQAPGAADWSAFWFGCLVGAAPWVAIFIYVAGAPTVPGFVWAITITQLLLFGGFALNMALQYRQVGKWRDYVYGERAYILLSLVAKTLLAWLIFANVLRT